MFVTVHIVLSLTTVKRTSANFLSHLESLRQERQTPVLEPDHSDHDTGFIEPSSNGSGGEEEGSKGGGGSGYQITSPDLLLPDPRPQDESYSSIDVIEASVVRA